MVKRKPAEKKKKTRAKKEKLEPKDFFIKVRYKVSALTQAEAMEKMSRVSHEGGIEIEGYEFLDSFGGKQDENNSFDKASK